MWFSVFPLPILHKHVRVATLRARLKQLTYRVWGWAAQLPIKMPLTSPAPCISCHSSDFSAFHTKSCLCFWTSFLTARALVKGSHNRETFHSIVTVHITLKVSYDAASVQLGGISTALWAISACSTNQWEFYGYIFYKLVSYITQEWLQNPTLHLYSGNSGFS